MGQKMHLVEKQYTTPNTTPSAIVTLTIDEDFIRGFYEDSGKEEKKMWPVHRCQLRR